MCLVIIFSYFFLLGIFYISLAYEGNIYLWNWGILDIVLLFAGIFVCYLVWYVLYLRLCLFDIFCSSYIFLIKKSLELFIGGFFVCSKNWFVYFLIYILGIDWLGMSFLRCLWMWRNGFDFLLFVLLVLCYMILFSLVLLCIFFDYVYM